MKAHSFLASELVRVRLTCQKCPSRATVEAPIERLDLAFPGDQCPVCHTSFHRNPDDRSDYLALLARALQGLAAIKDSVLVEFVIPDES